MNRRSFLKSTVAGAAAIPFGALVQAQDKPGVRRGHTQGYGPLFETPDQTTGLPLLLLPQGFKYTSFGWTGDPLDDETETPTPNAHDGMAAFDAGNGIVRLVRNHERGGGTPFGPTVYDPASSGGTTTLDFDPNKGKVVSAFASLSGTSTNCAGGPTPWGSWLTCEETTTFTTMAHGYVFDVPADGQGDPKPLKAMGRFSHEAVAVDPATGYVYETQDQGNTSGFYRFVPSVAGTLTAGQLFMLKVKDDAEADLFVVIPNDTIFDVEWVPIATPDFQVAPAGVYVRELCGGARPRSRRGVLRAPRRLLVRQRRQDLHRVDDRWRQRARPDLGIFDPAAETLRMVFQSPGADVLNAPDNICVSPRGGLVLCEDGSGQEFLHGLTVNGEIFRFAQNNAFLNGERNDIVGDFSGSEFAGACFSPDGHYLFVNIQSPGITFAISGPWGSGAL